MRKTMQIAKLDKSALRGICQTSPQTIGQRAGRTSQLLVVQMNRFRVVTGVIITSCFLMIGCGAVPSSWPQKKFQAEEWEQTPDLSRYVFAKDLLDGRLSGKTPHEIKALLGPPTVEYPGGVRYAIKDATTMMDAADFIYIHFDLNGRANEIGIVSD